MTARKPARRPLRDIKTLHRIARVLEVDAATIRKLRSIHGVFATNQDRIDYETRRGLARSLRKSCKEHSIK